MSIDTALAFTLPSEGGYVDNHWDHGGPTNHGITQPVYDDWRDEKKLPRQGVMMLTDQEVRAIYAERYWTAAHCDALPDMLGVCHFDWACNGGVLRAIKTLQAALGITSDGVWGLETAHAVAYCDAIKTCHAYNGLRRQWYVNRVQERPDQHVFLKGWLDRMDKLDALVATPA